MKLTEQQLAQLFKDSCTNDSEADVDFLYDSSEASDKRLSDVEKIANNSQLSASYQVINQLHDWSNALGNDIQLSLRPSFMNNIMAWMRPSLATAAIVTTVYFITPNMMTHSEELQQKPDRIMFTSSFENHGTAKDTINSHSFDQKNTDTISKSNFG